jgi:RND family efflux transporter MFP subunit
MDRDQSAQANRPTEARRRVRLVSLTLFAIVILAAIGFAPRWWRERQLRANVNEVDSGVPLVTLAHPERAPANTDLVLPGSIQAVQETAIYSRVDGYLKRRLVNIGDRVQSGQILAEIDTPELDQQFYQAKAALAQAMSALQQARAALQHNESQLDYNRTTLERWRVMKEKSLVAQQEVDDRTVLVKSGQADVDAARANVAAAEANVTASQANLERIANLQAFQKIRAPFAGVITVRNVDNGALIGAGSSSNTQPLFRMAQTDSLRIFVNLPQSVVPAMAPGLSAEVAVREYPQKHFDAQVASVSGALDPASRTLLTEVRMRNDGDLLRPGMYADVKFNLKRINPPLIVPASALIVRAGPPRIATLGAANKVHFQTVQLGRDYGATVEVVDGLNENDQLLIAPPDDLQDGGTVKVLVAAAKAKPPGH